MYPVNYENGTETYEMGKYTITVSRNDLTGGNRRGLFEVALWENDNLITSNSWLTHRDVAELLSKYNVH